MITHSHIQKFYRLLLILIPAIFLVHSFVQADEGMFPLSELHKLNLKARGLKIASKEIYNPNGISLVDAIVNVGGCTGSFVSDQGLVITNHHCAFNAVQDISTVENDYLTNGFLARTRSEERPAKGFVVRITESYRDVSDEILKGISDTTSSVNRTRLIQKNIRELVAREEKLKPSKRIEVSEMFPGKTYILFVYTNLQDVRLVYVPPRAIGEFGGELDNWTWPRHNGDFSFVRAYVAPDGSPAEYSPNNIPFTPKKFLKVAPEGVNENDPVFILGYPGRTFRHRTSHYLRFEQEVRLPFIAELFQWQIATMEKMGENNSAVALKHAARVNSLSNVEKNYRGKIKGLKHLPIIETKIGEEKALQKFIESDAGRKAKYGTLLSNIDREYQQMRKTAEKEFLLDNLTRSVLMLSIASTIYESSVQAQKLDSLRDPAFTQKNLPRVRKNLSSTFRDLDASTDKIFLKEFLRRALKLLPPQNISAIGVILKNDTAATSIDAFVENAYAASTLLQEKNILAAIGIPLPELEKKNDPFIAFIQALQQDLQSIRQLRQQRDGTLNKLFADLLDVKKEFQKKDFIPDANSTLRFTNGTIKGYSPADATYHRPITTIRGVVEKHTGKIPYNAPALLLDLQQKKDYGSFKNKKLDDLPVAILYDMDTTGGNSGSPVMNARGEIVGINFDRTFEATVNDYAWDEAYSRSIAVDIRYVLWVTQKIGNAPFLLQEMGVK